MKLLLLPLRLRRPKPVTSKEPLPLTLLVSVNVVPFRLNAPCGEIAAVVPCRFRVVAPFSTTALFSVMTEAPPGVRPANSVVFAEVVNAPVPIELLLVTVSEPAVRLVPPMYRLLPDRVRLPVPVLAIDPLPDTTPVRVKLPAPLSTVPAACVITALATDSVPPPLASVVLPFNVIAPVPAPRATLSCNVPFSTMVPPEKLMLLPPSASVP